MVHEILRRIDLNDRPLAHHGDSVGDLKSVGKIMRHEQDHRPELLVRPPQLLADLDPGDRVDVRHGLIKEKNARRNGDGAADRHLLPLARAQTARAAASPALADPQAAHHAARALVQGVRQPPANFQGETQVRVSLRVEHLHVRPQGVVLKHQLNPAPAGRHAVHPRPVEVDVARVLVLHAGDQAQQGGFPATGRPDERHEFPVLQREGEAIDRPRAVEILSESRNSQRAHRPASL